MFNKISFWFYSLLTAALFTSASQGAYLTLGTSAVTGTMESYPTNNIGGGEFFPCGTIQNVACGTTNNPFPCRNRGLIKFDVAGNIPAGSRITSVRLIIWMSLQPPNDETDPNAYFDFHRLLVSWGEGTGLNVSPGSAVGRPALTGESSWNYRHHPNVPWGAPGGAAGVDYSSLVSASVYVTANPSDSPFLAIAESNRLVQDFQFWLNNPGQNHGWLMKGQNENDRWTGKRFLTPESGIDDYPRVEVTYIAPPQVANLEMNGTNVTFEFFADEDQAYQAQFRNTLTSGNWQTFSNVPATNYSTNLIIFDSLGNNVTQRFYRVIAP